MNPQMRAMLQMFKNGMNPQSMMQSMMSARNPQVAQAMQYVRDNGGDAKAAFYKLAAEKGADPEAVMRMINGS